MNIVKYLDPRLKTDIPSYMVEVGAPVTTLYRQEANSVGNSIITWNIVVPSPQTFVDRNMTINLGFRVSATANGVPVAPKSNGGARTGLRQFPIASVIQTYNLVLNNSANCSLQYSNEIVHALFAFGCKAYLEELNQFYGGTPVYPDQSFTYEGSIAAGSRNPFVSHYDNTSSDTRKITDWNTSTDTNTFYFDLYENVLVSPLYWGSHRSSALNHLTNINLTLTMASNLDRIFSGVIQSDTNPNALFPATTPAGVPVVVSINVEKAEFTYIALTKPLDIAVPDTLLFPYHSLKVTSKDIRNAIPAGQKGNEVLYDNDQLPSIPTRSYFFVKEIPTSTRANVDRPDTYMFITKADYSFNNQDARLNAYSPYDLVKMSQRNGLAFTWTQARKYTGYPLCIEYGTDIALNAPYLASGVSGTYNSQMRLGFDNITDVAFAQGTANALRAYVIHVFEGYLSITNQQVAQNVQPFTPEMIQAVTGYSKDVMKEHLQNIYGGSFGSFFKKVWSGIKSVGSVVKNIANGVAQVAPFIPVYGPAVGAISGAIGNTLGAVGAGRRSGARKGGARMRSRSILRRL